MEGFAYCAPTSVAEAVAVLKDAKQSGRRAQPLAGGTDLLVQLRSVDRGERLIVDLKRIPETTRIDLGAATITIGAAVSAALLTRHSELGRLFPGLIEAIDLIGSTQIQGRATFGGNLCNSSPAGDTIPALFANAAKCVIQGSGGVRRVAVENFVTGVGDNVLADDEFLLALEFARPGPRTADAYLRFIPRTEMDIAVAGAGVSLTLDAGGVCTAARVAIGAVAPTVLLVPAAAEALIGSKVDQGAIDRAGAACSAAARPINDKRGTIEYRRKVVGVLCRRATAAALERARAEGGKA